jgi:hypothetical protein
MLVIKTIVLMCIVNHGGNLQYPKNLQDMDAAVSRCTDKVAECYYNSGSKSGLRGDVFECLKKEKQREEVNY